MEAASTTEKKTVKKTAKKPVKKAAPKKKAKAPKKASGAKMQMSPPNTYKWDKVFDGKKHTFKHGSDFKCSERSFIIYAYNRARKHGSKIEVKTVSKGVLTIRAKSKQEVKDEAKAAAAKRKAG